MTTEPADPTAPPREIPPREIQLGHRVVMRYRLPSGHPQPLTDVIGELVSLDPPTVRATDGAVTAVASDRVVALKAVGPRPIRTSEIRALESAAANGWPGIEHAWIDGWLVRAGHGHTWRANSALPLGEYGAPADLSAETILRIDRWYTQRGLPPLFSLPDRLAPVPPGWRTWRETVVLGLDIGNLVLPQGPPMVRIAREPNAAWLEMYRHVNDLRDEGESHAERPDSAPIPGVLTAVRDGELGFAALGVPHPIAIGRGALTSAPDGRRWIGLTCIAVGADHRRHGLGALVCAELIRWGGDRGATHAYVQVEAGNSGALALYRDLGFLDHHGYRYATPPV